MNDTYEYRMLIKGKRSNCYALIGTIPSQSLFIENEEIYKDNCTLLISGFGIKKLNVKNLKKKIKSFTIPDDYEEAKKMFAKKFLDMSMHDRSKYFNVELWVNSANADKGHTELLAHYLNGKIIDQERPEEIELDDQLYIDSIDSKNDIDHSQVEEGDIDSDYEEYQKVSSILDKTNLYEENLDEENLEENNLNEEYLEQD